MKTLRPRRGVVRQYLQSLPLFDSLAPAQLEGLAERSILRSYTKGEQVFEAGTLGLYLHGLLRGSLRVVRRLPDGRAKVLHLVTGPALVGEAPTLLGEPFPADAVCSEECLVLAVERSCLLQAAAEDPDLPWRLMGGLLGRLRQLTGALATHARKSSTARVASYLLGCTQASGSVELPAAKKDVANYLGLRPESFSRALRDLQDRGALSVDGETVRVDDRAALERALDES